MREYDLATVCKWIGNSPAMAAQHYAMSQDLNADFRRAAGIEAHQKAQQSAAAGDVQAMTPESLGIFPEKPLLRQHYQY